jgi:hypothetical protein
MIGLFIDNSYDENHREEICRTVILIRYVGKEKAIPQKQHSKQNRAVNEKGRFVSC